MMLLKNTSRDDDESAVAVLQDWPKSLLALCVSPAMRAIETVLADLATTGIPIMLLGETGTGKEVIGRAIHQLSGRRHRSFIKMRCSGLRPEDLGPFLDGAKTAGVRANCETVFLDEVADMSGACQTRLVEAFSGSDGEAEGFRSGACVISTTCQSLEERMEEGSFRRDLYYRLTGVCLRLPPLRHRREDVMPLANYFLDKYAAAFGRPRPKLSEAFVQVLGEYSWPGNIRELENAIKRVVVLGDERLAWKGLVEPAQENAVRESGQRSYSLKQTARAASRQAERELILKVLSETRWNRKRAAEELRISYKALLYKLKQIGIEETVS